MAVAAVGTNAGAVSGEADSAAVRIRVSSERAALLVSRQEMATLAARFSNLCGALPHVSSQLADERAHEGAWQQLFGRMRQAWDSEKWKMDEVRLALLLSQIT